MAAHDELFNGIQSPTITDCAVLIREVRVKIGVLSRYVTIRIYQSQKAVKPFTFELSALMRTREGELRDDDRGAESEMEALRRAIRILTMDYEDSVRRGDMPDDRWLVEQGPE